jgi:hypothetical protein
MPSTKTTKSTKSKSKSNNTKRTTSKITKSKIKKKRSRIIAKGGKGKKTLGDGEYALGDQLSRNTVAYSKGSKRDKLNKRLSRPNKRSLPDVDIKDVHVPIAIEITDNVSIKNIDLYARQGIEYPKLNTGFVYWTHINLNKKNDFKKFEGKKPVYRVIDAYYSKSDNDKNLDALMSKSHGSIVSDGFYHMWEIAKYFGFDSMKSVKSLHVNDDGGSAQGLHAVRNKKGDSYTIVSSNVPKSVTKHKNVSVAKSIKDSKAKGINLVTYDSGLDWSMDNQQEQENNTQLMKDMYDILSVQAKGANMVIKMYETFTDLSKKYMLLMKNLYDKVYMIKPLSVSNTVSDQYMVCVSLKDPKHKLIAELKGKTFNNNLIDFATDISIPINLISQLSAYNISLVERQFMTIGKMIIFIRKNNYHGDAYETYRERQLEHTEYWLEKFVDGNDGDKLLKTALKNESDVYEEAMKGYDVNMSIDRSSAKPKKSTKSTKSKKVTKTSKSKKVTKSKKATKPKKVTKKSKSK